MIETAGEFIERKTNEWERKKTAKTKDISRAYKIIWHREAFSFMKQTNYPEKVFVVERLRKEKFIEGKPGSHQKKGDIEYRLGYYIVGKIGRTKDKWMWGQFCPLIPVDDYNRLIEKAKKENVIL